MKKLISLFVTVMMTLTMISSASAVEIIDTNNTTPAAEGNWELCSWLLDENGYLCAQKYREADTLLPINETAKSIAGIVGNGKVERAHARHLVTLDERRWVDVGDSEPVWCRVEFLELEPKDQAEFEKFGITTCEELEDQLTEAFKVDTTPEGEVIYGAYYRAVEIKLEETELDVAIVARVYVGDEWFHVILVDYDQDGKRELALHLGLMPTGKSSEPKKENTTTGGTDFTIGGEDDKEDTTTGGTDFTIGGSEENNTSNGGGTDFTIGGSSSSNNNSSNGNHNGWSDALTSTGGSSTNTTKSESTDSNNGGTGFTIQ